MAGRYIVEREMPIWHWPTSVHRQPYESSHTAGGARFDGRCGVEARSDSAEFAAEGTHAYRWSLDAACACSEVASVSHSAWLSRICSKPCRHDGGDDASAPWANVGPRRRAPLATPLIAPSADGAAGSGGGVTGGGRGCGGRGGDRGGGGGTMSQNAPYGAKRVLCKSPRSRALESPKEAVLSRAEDHISKGNLEEAAMSINELTGHPQKAAESWLADVRALLETQRALDVAKAQANLLQLRLG